MLITGLFPVFRWNNGISRPLLLKIGLAACLAVMATLLIDRVHVATRCTLLYSARRPGRWWPMGRVLWLWSHEGNLRPGYVSHIGVALAFVGAAVANGFETKQTVNLTMNQPTNVMGYSVTFTDIVQTPKGFECHVSYRQRR